MLKAIILVCLSHYFAWLGILQAVWPRFFKILKNMKNYENRSNIFKCIIPLISRLIFHPQTNIQSSFTHLHVVPNSSIFILQSKTQNNVWRMFKLFLPLQWMSMRSRILEINSEVPLNKFLCVVCILHTRPLHPFFFKGKVYLTTLSYIINNQIWIQISINTLIQFTIKKTSKNKFW